MLREYTLFGYVDKVQIATDRIKNVVRDHPELEVIVAFSGGKDSVVIKHLAFLAGVKFRSIYNVTGIDPPDLIRFIRVSHPDTEFSKHPAGTFFKLSMKKGFPMRRRRWCCEYLKERSPNDCLTITGIRWEESPRRKSQRKLLECNTLRMILNPIIDWTCTDVWEFIRSENLDYCNLYDAGFNRLGCMLCPFSSLTERKLVKLNYPKVYANFERCFVRIYENKLISNPIAVKRWSSGSEMFRWWVKCR